MTSRRRIAILFHENEERNCIHRFAIGVLAEFWIEDGHKVAVLRGTRRRVDADILIVHVDLSVVPDSYLAFARHYPISVNGRLKDIRKSAFATNLVGPADPYPGPVIVKSDLNCEGSPEARLVENERNGVKRNDGHQEPGSYRSGFRVFLRLGDVSPAVFARPDLVVQKFQPEVEGQYFCVRNMHCLGNYVSAIRLKSRDPIVKSSSCLPDIEDLEPEPELLALRRRLHLDYGKLDYVKLGEKVVLLDINKTTGAGRLSSTPRIRALRRKMANGLYDFFK